MAMARRRGVWLKAALAVCVLSLTGCAVKSAVHSYADPGVDLRRFREYSWGAGDRVPTGDPRLDNNEIFEGQVRAAVDRQLAARGLTKTDRGTSELLVHYHASVSQQIDLSRVEPFARCPECKPFIYDAGTLVIDLVDASTGKMVWRGWSEGNVDGVMSDQRWMEDRIESDVTRIFQRLPR
jgi:hypothetical protein